MNPETNNHPREDVAFIPAVKTPHPVHQVTTLSKTLAAIIFIAMPFVGGYVGYRLAPERVVEVPTVVTAPVQSSAVPVVSLQSVPDDAQHVLFDGEKTGYFSVSGQMYYAPAESASGVAQVGPTPITLLPNIDVATAETFGRFGAFLISDTGIYYGTEYVPSGLKKDTEIYWKKDTMDAYQIFVHDKAKNTWITNGAANDKNIRTVSTVEKPDLATLTQPETFPSELTMDHKVCADGQSSYGFLYYVSSVDGTKVCYGDLVINVADTQSLMPLDSESPNYLLDVVVPPNTSHYAFDKNNFYADGKIIYSVAHKNFSLIKSVIGVEDRGQVSINGKIYLFGHTGLMGVTLLPNK